MLAGRAQRRPEGVAFIYLADGERETGRLTFGQLDARARSLAAHLLAHAAPGSTVLLLHPPGLEFITAFFGCLYAGLIAVPAYPPRPNRSSERLGALLVDSAAAAVLTASSAVQGVQRQLAALPAGERLPCIATDGLAGAAEAPWTHPRISGETLAFLQYTSGSTALPKGVKVSHGNILANLEMIRAAFGHGAETIGVGWLPMYHDMGLIGNVLEPVYLGIPCVLMPPVAFLQQPARWLRAITRYRATTSGGPDFAYELCAREIADEEKSGLDLSSWEVAFNGAEPVRSRTLDQFAAAFASCGFRRNAFYPCYGMAEASLFVSGGAKGAPPVVANADESALSAGKLVAPRGGGPSRALVGCGRAWLGQRLAIVQPESRTVLEEGAVGEIWLAGPSIAQGYWNRPEENERVFGAFTSDGEGPFLRTGDLGTLLGGELFVTGRLKDLIVIRGRNIYPQDIELCVEEAHAALRRGGSAAFSAEMGGEERLVVVAEVEREARRLMTQPRDGAHGGLVQQVARAARRAIAEQHDVQLSWLVLIRPHSLPKTSSGKVRRSACRELLLSEKLERVAEDRYHASDVLSGS